MLSLYKRRCVIGGKPFSVSASANFLISSLNFNSSMSIFPPSRDSGAFFYPLRCTYVLPGFPVPRTRTSLCNLVRPRKRVLICLATGLGSVHEVAAAHRSHWLIPKMLFRSRRYTAALARHPAQALLPTSSGYRALVEKCSYENAHRFPEDYSGLPDQGVLDCVEEGSYPSAPGNWGTVCSPSPQSFSCGTRPRNHL